VSGLRGRVTFGAELRAYTSFRIGGPADALVEPADVDDVRRLVVQARKANIPLFVVGGTNLLVRDGGIRGIVVSLAKLRAVHEEPESVLYAEGGVGMPTLIGYAIRRSLAGLEWAAGIPGTVGGCLVMNAGTRLGEMKDAVKAVRLVTTNGSIRDLPAASIPFQYRRARLPKGIVVGVWLLTGFAMVILSAGLKGISTELLEAARVDGANEVQVFRRIILPLLAPTIAVVATTVIIYALKTFDVVYTMTNGNFNTNVIANLMYQQLFNSGQGGRAAAVAVILLLAIVPVMYVNIRRFREQEAIR